MGESASGPTDEEETSLQSLVAGGVIFCTLALAFGLLAMGVSSFWIVFPIGFGGGLPLAMGLVEWYESKQGGTESDVSHDDETDRALAELRERYARGELTDEEFERRVERLLETESVPDATAYTGRDGRGTDGDRVHGHRGVGTATDERDSRDEDRERA